MSMRHIDMDDRFVINPELRRQPGAEWVVHVRNACDRLIGVPDESRELLLHFFEPHSIREVRSSPTERELSIIAAMLDQRVLLGVGELPRTCCAPRLRANTPFALAPHWDDA